MNDYRIPVNTPYWLNQILLSAGWTRTSSDGWRTPDDTCDVCDDEAVRYALSVAVAICGRAYQHR